MFSLLAHLSCPRCGSQYERDSRRDLCVKCGGPLFPRYHPRAIDRGAAAACAEGQGAIQELFERTVAYLKQRVQFGVPIGSFQALQHRAADMYVLLELATSLSLYATMALSDGIVDPTIASRAKLQVGRSARSIGQEAIQMHGGIGMTAEYPVGHYVSRLTAIEHTLGSTEDHLRVLVGAIADCEARVAAERPAPTTRPAVDTLSDRTPTVLDA